MTELPPDFISGLCKSKTDETKALREIIRDKNKAIVLYKKIIKQKDEQIKKLQSKLQKIKGAT